MSPAPGWHDHSSAAGPVLTVDLDAVVANYRLLVERVRPAKVAGVDFVSFWPTHNPFYGWSYRYALGRLNHIGIGNWKGRELDLRRPAAAPQAEARTAGKVQLVSAEANQAE